MPMRQFMTVRVGIARGRKALALAVLGIAALGQPTTALAADYTGHGAIGSWYGKAIQVCATGVAPSACANGQPAVVLLMTPTLTPEGLFVADDSLDLFGAPFGPHTTAHGQWYPTSSTEFVADYAFMLLPYPTVPNAVAGFRARWLAQVVDESTLVGWVNGYATRGVPLTWQPLAFDQFPSFPPEAASIVTPKPQFVTDPATCRTEDCPLVFKFTLKRVAP